VLALRTLRRGTVGKAAACSLVIAAHAWARSTERSDLADRLRALAWHR
jgi:hypothetical protein